MKILDVDPFQEGLQKNSIMLDRLESEMKAIEIAIEGLVAMEDSLKGQGGNAIRAFYSECHLPFVQYFLVFKNTFASILTQIESALHTLEPSSNGFIRENFLEVEVESGLSAVSQLTTELTDEANCIMAQVQDIVALPHLNDHEVQQGVRDGKRKRNETVTNLNQFDAEQTNALSTIESSLTIMENWLVDLEGLFKNNLTGINFPKADWIAYSTWNPLKKELTHQEMMGAPVSILEDRSTVGSILNTQNLFPFQNSLLFNEGRYPSTPFSSGFLHYRASASNDVKEPDSVEKTSTTDYFIDGDTVAVGENIEVTGGAGMYKNDWSGFDGYTNGDKKIGGSSEASLIYGKVGLDTTIIDGEGTINVLKGSADARIGGESVLGLNLPLPLAKVEGTVYGLEGKTQFDREIPYLGKVIGGTGIGAGASIGNAKAYAGFDKGSVGIGAKASVAEAEVNPTIGIPFTDINAKLTLGVSAIGIGGEAKIGKEILIDLRLLFGAKVGISFENESQ
ncbi:LXG domain-containing protein [Filibacter tadaridae]|uniref:Ribonuclease YxiD n=1 Tax=Filibacter tadaridae TaxID=2483811 RepID=A0A3P5WU76_9BACL|nr:LXG domain-containing protein [Filibacter tadaridae]VDC25128.1 Ribonuclease YxiD [Filibacter tadaridae]